MMSLFARNVLTLVGSISSDSDLQWRSLNVSVWVIDIFFIDRFLSLIFLMLRCLCNLRENRPVSDLFYINSVNIFYMNKKSSESI